MLLLLMLRGSQDLPVNELIFHPASGPPPPPVNDWHFPIRSAGPLKSLASDRAPFISL